MQTYNINCCSFKDVENLKDYIKPRFNNYNGFYTHLIIKCNVTINNNVVLLNIRCKSKAIFSKLKRELNIISGVSY